MPARPSPGQVVELAFEYALANDANIINRIFIAYTGTPPTNAQLVTFCNAAQSAFNTNITPGFTTECTFRGCGAVDLSSATGGVGVSTGAAQAGSSAAPPLAAGTSAVISFKIHRRYRGGHPRIYLPGTPSNELVNANQWSSAYIAALESTWQAVITAILAAGWSGAGALTHVNVSFFEGFHNFTYPSGRTWPIPTLRATPLVDLVTGYVVNPNVASQRRRDKQSA